MKYSFREDDTEYQLELHKITPAEFERLRKNDALTWHDGIYKLNEDVVATETGRVVLYNKKYNDIVPAMLLPGESFFPEMIENLDTKKVPIDAVEKNLRNNSSLERAMEVLQAMFVRKINDDGWKTICYGWRSTI